MIRAKRMLGAINDSYEYEVTGEIGKKLKKMYRKVKRQLPEVSIDQLVEGIIQANESETLCEVQGLSRYAKSISVEI